MKIILILLLIASFASFASNAESINAWWVDFRYAPKSTSLFGISASEISKEFTHIELYSCDTDKYFTKSQCQEIKKFKGLLKITGDFNKDGVLEIWNIGISKLKDGSFSHTVIIRNFNTKIIEQVLTVEVKEPMFSILNEHDGKLTLLFCMGCQYYVEILWVDNKWVLEWPEEWG